MSRYLTVSRDSIYAALFALAAAAQIDSQPAFKFTFRRLMHFEDVPAQPALLMEQLPEEDQAKTNLPNIVTLKAHLWIYARTGQPTNKVIAATLLNNLVDAVATALEPPPIEPTLTLGGLVTDARIEGPIMIDEGPLDDQQGIVRIPITIVATN